MNARDVRAFIKNQQSAIEAEGVTSLYLFGSVARGEADSYSDIDIALETKDDFSLIDLVGVRQLLEDSLKIHVDVVMREDLTQMNEKPELEIIKVF